MESLGFFIDLILSMERNVLNSVVILRIYFDSDNSLIFKNLNMQASNVHAAITGERNYRRLPQADTQRRLLCELS
jgi:hypothetical protein